MIVDVSKKPDIIRYARASAGAEVEKCNTAAAVRAALNAGRYLPFLHPLPLRASAWCENGRMYVEGFTEWQTGVEMDVLFGALVGLVGSGARKITKLVVESKLKHVAPALTRAELVELPLARQGDLVASAYGKMVLINKNLVTNGVEKGHPLYAAQTAAALNVKRFCEIVGGPCPTVQHFKIDIEVSDHVEVRTLVKTRDIAPAPEAMFATGVALLTIWDMLKKYEKNEEGQYPNTYIEVLFVE